MNNIDEPGLIKEQISLLILRINNYRKPLFSLWLYIKYSSLKKLMLITIRKININNNNNNNKDEH
jgi:hypothetical protein